MPKLYWWEERKVYNHIAPIVDTRISLLQRIKPKLVVRPGTERSDADRGAARVSSAILTSLTYDLDLAEPRPGGEPRWVDFAQGTFREPIRVAGHDSTLVEVPVEFTYEGAGAALRSILDMGTFTYRVAGTVELREPMRRDVPYRHQGTVSLAGVR